MFRAIPSRFTVAPLLSVIGFLPSIVGRHVPPPQSRIVAFSPADTGQDPALVPLTPELITNYLAVSTALNQYLPSHQSLVKDVPSVYYQFNLDRPDGKVEGRWGQEVPDWAVGVTKDTTVAKIFTKYHLSPAQFGPLTITIRKALFAADLHKKFGIDVKDPTSVASKNMTLIEAHREAFVGSELEFKIKDNRKTKGHDSTRTN